MNKQLQRIDNAELINLQNTFESSLEFLQDNYYYYYSDVNNEIIYLLTELIGELDNFDKVSICNKNDGKVILNLDKILCHTIDLVQEIYDEREDYIASITHSNVCELLINGINIIGEIVCINSDLAILCSSDCCRQNRKN